jgi:BolA protein
VNSAPNASRIEAMRARLATLAPLVLEIVDESHKHAGHVGARGGRGHFAVRIVSAAFDGLPLLARHRRVYAALDSLMQTDIHALSLQTLTPSESE